MKYYRNSRIGKNIIMCNKATLTKEHVMAGIVLYNPDIDRLKENIKCILPQVDTLLLVENGSSDTSYINDLKNINKTLIVRNHKSMGIAYALNQILGYGYSHGFKWVLTLDQDSVVSSNMIGVYKDIANDDIGIIGCWIDDRNYKRDETWGIRQGTFDTDWVITSAAYTNVLAWKNAGGYDTGMFIDWVDWDICEAMRIAGYRIVKTYKTKLVHENGEGTYLVKVRNHEMQVMNRPAFRYYYNFRNQVYLARKYKHLSIFHESYELAFKFYTVLRYERNKWKNFIAMLRGYFAGFGVRPCYNSLSPVFFDVKAKKI